MKTYAPGTTVRFKSSPDIEARVVARTETEEGWYHRLVWWNNGSRIEHGGIQGCELERVTDGVAITPGPLRLADPAEQPAGVRFQYDIHASDTTGGHPNFRSIH